jgi:hypothetical protein
MTNRADLIARKQAVRGQIERARRTLAAEQAKADATSRRRVRKLENELERLMAEEYQLRVAIDMARS